MHPLLTDGAADIWVAVIAGLVALGAPLLGLLKPGPHHVARDLELADQLDEAGMTDSAKKVRDLVGQRITDWQPGRLARFLFVVRWLFQPLFIAWAVLVILQATRQPVAAGIEWVQYGLFLVAIYVAVIWAPRIIAETPAKERKKRPPTTGR